MKKILLIIIIVILLLNIWSIPAQATIKDWLLWIGSCGTPLGQTGCSLTWEIDGEYDSLIQCYGAAEQEYKAEIKARNEPVKAHFVLGTKIFVSFNQSDGTSALFSWRCLPKTIDQVQRDIEETKALNPR